jgi:hypothetical protein
MRTSGPVIRAVLTRSVATATVAQGAATPGTVPEVVQA